jgi:hypothetical protein
LRRSSDDERLDLLLKICAINEVYENNDKSTLRDISSVVGGDPTHEASFKIQVKSWLKELRAALSRVALSSGFSSSGLASALSHSSFIAATDGMSNGIIFDELVDFNDPTQVLAGAIEVIKEKTQSLESVSGASSKSQLRAANFAKRSAIENELGRPAMMRTRYEAGETTRAAWSKFHAKTAAVSVVNETAELAGRFEVTPYDETANDATAAQALISEELGRSTIIGPRLVYNVSPVDDDILDVEGGVSSVLYSGSKDKLTLVKSRFVVVGRKDESSVEGHLGGTNVFNRLMAGAMSLCTISDDIMFKLQSGPNTIGDTMDDTYGKINASQMPGCEAAGYWGLEKNKIVMIPLSGLGDIPDHTVCGEVDGEKFAGAGAADIWAESGSLDIVDDSPCTISTKRYLEIAKRHMGSTAPDFNTLMVVDLVTAVSVDEATTTSGTAEKGVIVQMSISGARTVSAPRSDVRSIIGENSVSPNVKLLRRAWNESELIKLVDGYDEFARSQGEDGIVKRAIAETISGAFRNDPAVLEQDFKVTLEKAGKMQANDTGNNDKVFEKLKDSDFTGTYVDPLDCGMWVGPDKAASKMRPLNKEGKDRTFRRWARVLDYLALIALTNVDYTDGFR